MEDTRYKTFWRRFGANFIDGLLLGFGSLVILIPILFIIIASSIKDTSNGEADLGGGGAAAFVMTIVLFAAIPHVYTIWMHARFGQTVGKMATNVIVRDHQTGGPIGWRQAFFRSSGEIAIQVFGFALILVLALNTASSDVLRAADVFHGTVATGWFIAELVTMMTNERRRALHDLIAGTVVIKKEYIAALPPSFAPPPAKLGW